MNTKTYDALALFSGGLDSILAVKAVEEQGLKVKCLHFVSPFFGKPNMLKRWQRIYGLDIEPVDIGEDFVRMLRQRPEHGFGKMLNPCVDCKILMMNHARELMPFYGAKCIVSGEVVGQRPMSQRRETLNIIKRESQLKHELLRPLSAKLLDATSVEQEGLIDRNGLYAISGRGRKDQLALAKKFGITEIPTPAGGCLLAEQENACRYWNVLQYVPDPHAPDFVLAQTGRQYWAYTEKGQHWLIIGRNANNNALLGELKKSSDLLFRLCDFAGPLALGRQWNTWDAHMIHEAAAFVASFSSKAVQSGGPVKIHVRQGQKSTILEVIPTKMGMQGKGNFFAEPTWDSAKEILHKERQNQHKK